MLEWKHSSCGARLLQTARPRVGQPRRVEDAGLWEDVTSSYHAYKCRGYSSVRKVVWLYLLEPPCSLGAMKDFEVVVVNTVSVKTLAMNFKTDDLSISTPISPARCMYGVFE